MINHITRPVISLLEFAQRTEPVDDTIEIGATVLFRRDARGPIRNGMGETIQIDSFGETWMTIVYRDHRFGELRYGLPLTLWHEYIDMGTPAVIAFRNVGRQQFAQVA